MSGYAIVEAGGRQWRGGSGQTVMVEPALLRRARGPRV